MSDCLDAMDDPEFLSEDVMTDGKAVALVRGLVAGHLLLGSRQAEAEGRIHTCVDAALHTWTRARATAPRCKPWIRAFAMGPWSKPWARNSPSGPWSKRTTNISIPSTTPHTPARTKRECAANAEHRATEVLEACRRIESDLVAPQLAALGLRQFSGRLPRVGQCLSDAAAPGKHSSRNRASTAKLVHAPQKYHIGSLRRDPTSLKSDLACPNRDLANFGNSRSDLPSPRRDLTSPRLQTDLQGSMAVFASPAQNRLPAPATLSSTPEPAGLGTRSSPSGATLPIRQTPALQRWASAGGTKGAAGGNVDSLFLDTDRGSLYSATDGGSLYSATDGGSLCSASDGGSLYSATDGGSVYSAAEVGSTESLYSAADALGDRPAGPAVWSVSPGGGLFRSQLLARIRRAYDAPAVLRAMRVRHREPRLPLDSTGSATDCFVITGIGFVIASCGFVVASCGFVVASGGFVVASGGFVVASADGGFIVRLTQA